jgi:predicted transport protein
MAITIQQYIDCKESKRFVGLLHQIREAIQRSLPDSKEYAIPRYIAFKKRYNFVSLWLRHDSIFVETKRPRNKQNIGENIPDSHKYTLNYRMIITQPDQIPSMISVIKESYSQTS